MIEVICLTYKNLNFYSIFFQISFYFFSLPLGYYHFGFCLNANKNTTEAEEHRNRLFFFQCHHHRDAKLANDEKKLFLKQQQRKISINAKDIDTDRKGQGSWRNQQVGIMSNAFIILGKQEKKNTANGNCHSICAIFNTTHPPPNLKQIKKLKWINESWLKFDWNEWQENVPWSILGVCRHRNVRNINPSRWNFSRKTKN